MATKFYNVEKAAEILGVPVAEINQLRESHQLRGLRDGANWKFKAEEVESLALKMKSADSGIGSGIGIEAIEDLDFDIDTNGDADVLLSEPSSSDPSASGTVIGPPPEGDDHLDLGDDLELDDLSPIDSAVSSFEDLDLSIDESGLELASSGIGLDSDIEINLDEDQPRGHEPTGASSILGLADDDLDDDDLVLGGESGAGSGSGSGSSDITIGGDSGISLIDPADSGISLEEPLDLSSDSDVTSGNSGGGEGSFTLAGDSILSLADSAIESSSDLSSDGDDFMLSSMDEDEEDDSSQVIALEEAGSENDSILSLDDSSEAGILDSQLGMGSAVALDLDDDDDDEVVDLAEGLEGGSGMSGIGSSIDFGEATDDSFGSLSSMEGTPISQVAPAQDFGAAPAVAGRAVAAPSEGSYTKLDYFFLYSSFFTLGLCGIIMYDIIRNMLDWNGTGIVNSWLLNMFFG